MGIYNQTSKWFYISALLTAIIGIIFAIRGDSLTLNGAISVPTFNVCLVFILVMGTLGYTMMRFVLIRARPPYPKIFSSMVALLCALVASVGYGMFCSIDSITYIGTAYAAGILSVTGIGFLIPRKQWYL